MLNPSVTRVNFQSGCDHFVAIKETFKVTVITSAMPKTTFVVADITSSVTMITFTVC